MMKVIALVVLGILQFFEASSFSATRCAGLPADRLLICEAIEVAKKGSDCEKFKEAPVGHVTCSVVSQLASGKNCDTIQNPKYLPICNSVLSGFEYSEKLRNVRKERMYKPETQFDDPVNEFKGSQNETNWFDLGKYLGLHQPGLIEKRDENKAGIEIEKFKAEVQTKISDPILQEKALRIAKKTFYRLKSVSTTTLGAKAWAEKIADFVNEIEKSKADQIRKSQTIKKPLFSGAGVFPVHYTPEGQVVIHFDGSSQFRKILGSDAYYKNIYYGLDYTTEKVKALLGPSPNGNRDEFRKEMIVQSWFRGKPGIAQVDYWFEYDDAGPKILAVMDYFPMNLHSLMSKFKIYDSWEDEDLEELSVSMGMQIVQGLEEVHHQKVHHRDVKGPNILTDGKQALLTDFGLFYDLAIPPRPDVFLDSRALNIVRGTPYIVSPEYLSTGQHDLPSNDIWSLGMTLFELSTGEEIELYTGDPDEFSDWMSELILGKRSLGSIFGFVEKGQVKPLSSYIAKPGTLRFVAAQMLRTQPESRVSLSSALAQLQVIKTGNHEGPRFRFSAMPLAVE